jgi:tetratricopeptide (TPR) repeat protein
MSTYLCGGRASPSCRSAVAGTQAGACPEPSPRDARAHMEGRLEFNYMADDSSRQEAEDHYYAALDLVSEGEQQGALAEYEKSLVADPTFTEAMHGMARVLQDLNRLDEAIAIAKRIAELDPDDVLAHTSLSVFYQKKGMIPEAEEEANKARILGWKQQLKKG